MTDHSASTPSAVHDGIDRSAALLEALGKDADAVWQALPPEQAKRLREAIDRRRRRRVAEAASVPQSDAVPASFPASSPPGDAAGNLGTPSPLDTGLPADVAAFLSGQHPQLAAQLLARMAPPRASDALSELPPADGARLMARLAVLKPALPAANDAILHAAETAFREAGSRSRAASAAGQVLSHADPDGALARVVEAAPPLAGLLAGQTLRFHDFARFDAPALQTLILGTEPDVLAAALQGAPDDVSAAFRANMSERSGARLEKRINKLGPPSPPRARKARAELLSLAYRLIDRGDILRPAAADSEDELLEAAG